jgi:hypothetical protein
VVGDADRRGVLVYLVRSILKQPGPRLAFDRGF